MMIPCNEESDLVSCRSSGMFSFENQKRALSAPSVKIVITKTRKHSKS